MIPAFIGALTCFAYSMRADEVEYEEDEREPMDGEELQGGRDVDDDDEDEEEEGMNFDWVQIFVHCSCSPPLNFRIVLICLDFSSSSKFKTTSLLCSYSFLHNNMVCN